MIAHLRGFVRAVVGGVIFVGLRRGFWRRSRVVRCEVESSCAADALRLFIGWFV